MILIDSFHLFTFVYVVAYSHTHSQLHVLINPPLVDDLYNNNIIIIKLANDDEQLTQSVQSVSVWKTLIQIQITRS